MKNDLPSISNDDQTRHQVVILKDIHDQIKRLAEAMADVPKEVHELKSDVAELKSDMKVVKAAVTDTSKQVADHEHRITILENV